MMRATNGWRGLALAALVLAACDEAKPAAESDTEADGADTAVDTEADTEADAEADTSADTEADAEDTSPDTEADTAADTEVDTTLPPRCGDGLTQPELGEACDGTVPDDRTCRTEAFAAGTIACAADCQLDLSLCRQVTCGDGFVDGDEGCDDGNTVSSDGCSEGCVVEFCGDGTVQTGERCDDGNATSGDGCSALCIGERCGDGTLQAILGEACDDGAANSDTLPNACRTSCLAAGCGDGVLDSGEACDDGNLGSDDGCGPTCAVEFCGDGIAQPGRGEQCDDGNPTDRDGCTNACTREYCGDGTLQTYLGELCDDGNRNDTDGCNTRCVREFCGDGIQQSYLGELCDDGNRVAGDGCTNGCVAEFCGDGRRQSYLLEDCDDGNTVGNDGCSATCIRERCGDGVTQPALGEACDDGNAIDNDSCTNFCQLRGCGDGRVDALTGEACDDGNADGLDGCTNSCQREFCGDGVNQSYLGESCDDANTVTTDGCNACRREFCGDGLTQAYLGEACDDANLDNTDGCNSACAREFCGDGTVQTYLGELCDDGNFAGLDGCTNDCLPEFCGDGVTQRYLGEVCDDANLDNTDGCTTACRTEFCGDGIAQTYLGEACDDGNPNELDGCTTTCVREFCGDATVQAYLGESCDDGNTLPEDGCSSTCGLDGDDPYLIRLDGFVDLSGSGTPLPLRGDDATLTVEVGFEGKLFGALFTQATISTNGFFATGPVGASPANGFGTSTPNGIIAPFWDDLVVDNASSETKVGVYAATLGTAPHRMFVVQWHNVRVRGEATGAPLLDFEAVLYEGTGEVQFLYHRLSSATQADRWKGTSASIGVERNDGVVSFAVGENAATVTPGTLITLSPVGASYRANRTSVLGHNWEDPRESGYRSPTLSEESDGAGDYIGLPFDFVFYGQNYFDAVVSTNGYLTFLGDGNAAANTALPARSAPPAMVACFWDDLDLRGAGELYYETLGAAPFRRFVLTWTDAKVGNAADAPTLDFSMLLYEGSSVIECRYGAMRGGGSGTSGLSATIGLQNESGTAATTASFNEGIVEPGDTVLFVPASGSATATYSVFGLRDQDEFERLATNGAATTLLTGSETIAPLTLGFTLPWWATARETLLSVGATGWLKVGGGATDELASPTASTISQVSLIAPFWAPLGLATGAVRGLGTADRQLISWENVTLAGASGSDLSFQTTLLPTGEVRVRYGALAARTRATRGAVQLGGATVGLSNPGANLAIDPLAGQAYGQLSGGGLRWVRR